MNRSPEGKGSEQVGGVSYRLAQECPNYSPGYLHAQADFIDVPNIQFLVRFDSMFTD
jgi:hypothetical protein